MQATHRLFRCLWLGTLAAVCGCALVPRPQIQALRSQNRSLAEQNRAQLVEIENIRAHSQKTVERLNRVQEELALLEERAGLERRQLANYEQERNELDEQFTGMVNGQWRVSPEMTGSLAEISKRYPHLRFDPRTGIAKLEVDMLFDSGKCELKPPAEKLLGELVQVLNSPEGREMKVIVAGHTDDRQIAKKPGRDKYPNNFYLSTARANAVADRLRQFGLQDQRVGVAGFGQHQPIAPNVTPDSRRKNRRVEVFVMTPNVPVVGWTESMPSLY